MPAQKLSLDRTMQLPAECANLSIRDLQVHSFEIFPIADGILLSRDVHLQDLALRGHDASGVGWVINGLCHS